ncbi:hypothetical protein AAY473_018120 [Plecturocebus cupreus]
MVKARRAQRKMITFRLEKGAFVSNFAEHFTENPRSRAARVRRKTDDSEAKMDKNPMTWQPTPFSHQAPCRAKLPKVNASTPASTALETPMSMFTTAMTPINSLMEEMYRGDLKTVEVTKALQKLEWVRQEEQKLKQEQEQDTCCGLKQKRQGRRYQFLKQIHRQEKLAIRIKMDFVFWRKDSLALLPGWSAVVQSQLSLIWNQPTSWVGVILMPQPPKYLRLLACATTPG